jgi:hypothetical protein
MEPIQLLDGTSLVFVTGEPCTSPEDGYDDKTMVFDRFAHRDSIHKFNDHEAALAHAQQHGMHVFAVRAYSHSGICYHVVAADWDDKQNNPFPQRQRDGSDLPYPFNCQFDSAWAGYVMVSVEHILGEKTTTKRQVFKALLDKDQRAKAHELAVSIVRDMQGYWDGVCYQYEHLDADGTSSEGLSCEYYDEDECVDAAKEEYKSLIPVHQDVAVSITV